MNEQNDNIMRGYVDRRNRQKHFCLPYIQNVIKKFDLKKEQVLSSVTDNASSMINTVEIVNDEENVASSSEDKEGETEGDRIILNVNHMQCAVHTLQLAVEDALNSKQVFVLLLRVRTIAEN